MCVVPMFLLAGRRFCTRIGISAPSDVLILRKELALQLLIAFAVVVYGSAATNLNAFMSDHQLVVYALVSCLSVPCASTIAVLGREIGWRATFLLAVAILGVALLVGGVAHRLLPLV